MKALTIVKIGGHLIDDDQALKKVLVDFAGIQGPKILIHGGGRAATALAKKLDLEVQMLEGRRITDTDMLEVAVMVYAGKTNKFMVAKLQAFGCMAIGLTGADADLVRSKKRSVDPVDYGWVGDVKKVNAGFLSQWLEGAQPVVPVFCAITHDGNGQLLNTNADTMAAEIAVAMTEFYTTSLIYCFEKPGVLLDISDEDSLVTQLNQKDYDRLKKQGVIADGMLPKLKNCFYALNHGVEKISLGHPEILSDPHYKCTRISL
ncbi:acetylglutamate kinase [Nonlabens xiamenensis]|uniref:acetylglutamate kinase n=1 Tax=Nonlabens xiamenensis TaxID=2341043 RepID=UPI000F60FDEF|nr:acetylglutamate kinase [Nonlabens xiamenensis]